MIGIITYNVPHRKTQDLVSQLLLRGHTNLCLVLIPYIERKNHIPLYQHRPSECANVDVFQMCNNFNIDYTSHLKTQDFENTLIGGAGILSKELVAQHNIINSHSGYLPYVKGLDALKWAIYLGQPIGVTTHYIDENTDEGTLIAQELIPVYFEDTFHSLAQRLYETEIRMLVDSIEQEPEGTKLKDDRYPVNKRMSHHKELIMMERFEAIRKNSKSYRES